MQFDSVANLAVIFAAVLILGAMSGFFSERVGIANISINGQMIFSALMFAVFAELIYPRLGNESFVIPMLLSMVCTLAMSSLFAFLTIHLKANQIVAGTAINMLGAGLATFLTQPLGPLLSNGLHTKLQSDYLGIDGLGGSQFMLTSLLLFIAILIIAVGLWVLMKYTPFGLRLRAIGNNPNAVDAQGINVTKYQWIALSISGLLAGLAGSLFLYGNGGTFNGSVSGYGFLALAILIAGSWRIPLLAIVAILFAFLTQIFKQLTISNNIPVDVANLIPYAITLVGMIAFSKWNVAPKNIGIPFDKTKR
ncbi:ABC transporter permease [Ureaplasma ceti]|uniref:ABC transporter permease n=1 Tax=Ureaplasma ceti TaxID=3119530 RepID=A0ABP9U7R8_9BACT